MTSELMTPETLLGVVRKTLQAATYCFFITAGDEGGWPAARLMQPFAPQDDLTIWMGTSPASRKVRDVQQNHRVTLASMDMQENAYITMLGLASLEEDIGERQRFWRDAWSAFFPQGPTGDDYVLLRFVPERIEIMNFAQQITPPPVGLKPAVLLRSGEAWALLPSERVEAD